MNYALQHLAHLVEIKNELNRKRRRFYHLWNNATCNRWCKKPCTKHKVHAAFSVKAALEGYEAAKLEMKAMTKGMRELRKAAGANLVWSDHGSISAIKSGEYRYGIKDIARLAELYKADAILLGD